MNREMLHDKWHVDPKLRKKSLTTIIYILFYPNENRSLKQYLVKKKVRKLMQNCDQLRQVMKKSIEKNLQTVI